MDQPIRVLQVLRQMNRGGAEAMIMNLYRHIDRSKVQFDFIVHTEEEGVYDKEIEELGGRIFSVIRFNGKNIRAYSKACRNFFEHHPEIRVVHGHIGSCAAIYLKEAKRAGCFTIAHSHDAVPMDSAKRILFQLYAYPTRFIADWLFGCSTEAGISRYGKIAVKSSHYSNFYNAIDLAAFSYQKTLRLTCRTEFAFNESDIVVGTVGRLEDQKNPYYILQIFEKVVAMSEHTKCLWVGTGSLEGDIREKGKELINQGRLIMTGLRSDIPSIMNGMDVFILPSLFEGLPVVAVEAQTAGLPCILSDTITKEVDVTGDITWCSINSSPGAWAETIVSVADKKIDKRTNGYEASIKAGYDIDETSAWLCDFYLSHFTPAHD